MNPEEINQRLATIEERQKAILGNQKVIIAWQQQFEQRLPKRSTNTFKEARRVMWIVVGLSLVAGFVLTLI